jgi:hypothetical protein
VSARPAHGALASAVIVAVLIIVLIIAVVEGAVSAFYTNGGSEPSPSFRDSSILLVRCVRPTGCDLGICCVSSSFRSCFAV